MTTLLRPSLRNPLRRPYPSRSGPSRLSNTPPARTAPPSPHRLTKSPPASPPLPGPPRPPSPALPAPASEPPDPPRTDKPSLTRPHRSGPFRRPNPTHRCAPRSGPSRLPKSPLTESVLSSPTAHARPLHAAARRSNPVPTIRPRPGPHLLLSTRQPPSTQGFPGPPTPTSHPRPCLLRSAQPD